MRISKFPELISHLFTLHYWKKSGHFPDFCRQGLVKFLTQTKHDSDVNRRQQITQQDDTKSFRLW